MARPVIRLALATLFAVASSLVTLVSGTFANPAPPSLRVTPEPANAGDPVRFAARGFAVGEPIDARVVTPAGITLFLTPATPLFGQDRELQAELDPRPDQAPLYAGASGNAAWTVRTSSNFQTGAWVATFEGRHSRQTATSTLVLNPAPAAQQLAARVTPMAVVSTPTGTAVPAVAPTVSATAGPQASAPASAMVTPTAGTTPTATSTRPAPPPPTLAATTATATAGSGPAPAPTLEVTVTVVPTVVTPIPTPAAPTTSPSPQTATPGPTIPQPPPGPALAPAQLLPTFARASALTGVPQAVLLAIARVESGFDPRAVGPYLPQFAGTENEYALGMMQFLPGTYRAYMAAADAATGKQLRLSGIWDAESAIYAAAYYLRDSGAPADLRRALFAYNNANWYVDLILTWAGYYAGGVTPQQSGIDYSLPAPPAPGAAAPSARAGPPAPGNHIDLPAPIALFAPWTAGETWHAGGDGSFYGDGLHVDRRGTFFAVDFNKGAWPDSARDEGAPVLAAADGTVADIYQDAAGSWVVELHHTSAAGAQLRTLYAHLKVDPRVAPGISVGQYVPHGTPIGQVGSTGTSTGPHLHFEFAMLRDGAWVSARPEPMEGQWLVNGGNVRSTNTVEPGKPRYAGHQFDPPSPSNASTVTIFAAANTGSSPVTRIAVEVNSAADGSTNGAWLPLGAIDGSSGAVQWITAPVADGTYRVRFTYTAANGARSTYGDGPERPMRYTIRRGDFQASALLNPRPEVQLLAPLAGNLLSVTGGPPLTVSGPLRFGPLPAAGTLPAANGPTTGRAGLMLEAAATNLITNPSFERDTATWNTRGDTNHPLLVSLVDGGVAGRRAVRLDNRGGTADAVFYASAGTGAPAAWSVYVRGIAPGPARAQLSMSGLAPRVFDLTPRWQRVSMIGSTAGAGNERQVIVPAGTVLDLDAAQLESTAYTTSYLDGSLGAGYDWTGPADASISIRTASFVRLPEGLATPKEGGLSVTATPTGLADTGGRLLSIGDVLTLSVEESELVLRSGATIVARASWVQGERHRYDLSWRGPTVGLAVDGVDAGSALVPEFAFPADAPLTLGADHSGARAVNALVSDVELWTRPLSPADAATARLAAPGERASAGTTGAPRTAVALAVQGSSATLVQFSVDGVTWTTAGPANRAEQLGPPFSFTERILVRFTVPDGRHLLLILEPSPVFAPIEGRRRSHAGR